MHKRTHITNKGTIWFAAILCLFLFVACSVPQAERADRLNETAYSYHYRNLDSTRVFANRAFEVSDDYDAGKAEALNHLAFYHTAKMQYDSAKICLDSVKTLTDNELELLVADVQQMRLCQRQSHNKEFYDYYEEAKRRLQRIDDEDGSLNDHARKRLVYARSEMAIVTSTYYYYVGLEEPSIKALKTIDPEGEVRADTAQLIDYLYNMGAGGIITEGSPQEIAQQEFDRLLQCYVVARRHGYVFWEANALQAMSEHLVEPEQRDRLIADNLYAMKYVNTDQMPDSLLAGNLAQRSLELFKSYGDVYQTAGSYRTLASCYWQIGDYESALICLQDALYKNLAIEQAPDLVASIHEQLSLAYSAIDDKPQSDEHRNLYLDLHQQTRQDRQLESRAEQLDRSSLLLNTMIGAVVTAIVLLTISLFLFNILRRRSDRRNPISSLLHPLEEWKRRNADHLEQLADRYEEVQEAHALSLIHIANDKRRNLEQRAKVSLVNSVTPFIDRMLHEIKRLRQGGEDVATQQERYAYITEIVDKIDDYNDVLTQWIQLRAGELSLNIESFPLQQVLDVIKRSHMAFRLKGITLRVVDSDAVVKADRVLTLFMVNTLADNARKFTPEGGTVTVSATQAADHVEVAVCDTGCGMDEQQLATIFDHKVQGGHGFGLMNCKGIIEKYKKISRIFAVCAISAESKQGEGSRFAFRLPKGIARLLLPLLMGVLSFQSFDVQAATLNDSIIAEADRYADSAYYSNIRGTYERTILFADTCRMWLNKFYQTQYPNGQTLMRADEGTENTPAEVEWLHMGLKTDYNVILDVRNECAVAALALHQWDAYRYNNKIYTQLFKEVSADRTLGDYCRQMQRSETNKNVAIVLLVIVLLLILPAYYVIYYRHILHYRHCVERVKQMNELLLSDLSDDEKLSKLTPMVSDRFPSQLQDIVSQIIETLRESIARSRERETDIELAEDERRRAEYEDERLHVSNSILDNCLSTLKHETMYYPSRIRQLVTSNASDLQSIDELATYYKELYAILSEQAMRQVEGVRPQCVSLRLADVCAYASGEVGETTVMGDSVLMRHFFDLLQKQNEGQPLTVELSSAESRYVVLTLTASMLHHDEQTCQQLFTPSMATIPYLLCRQMVRDCGEATNLRGCGITAVKKESATAFVVTLPKGR